MPLSHERSRVGRQVSGLTTPHRRPHHGVGMRQRGGMYGRTICPCVAGAITSVSGTKTERAPNKMNKNEKRWAPWRFERAEALHTRNEKKQTEPTKAAKPQAASCVRARTAKRVSYLRVRETSRLSHPADSRPRLRDSGVCV